MYLLTYISEALYRESTRKYRQQHKDAVIQPSRPGVIITIAREHGSSGKQIGKLVAEKLGIPFYYKEMTALAAQESGLAQEFISDINQNAPNILKYLYLSTTVVQHAIVAQHKVIERIAENGNCVIVGRAADHVLRNHISAYEIVSMFHTRLSKPVMKAMNRTLNLQSSLCCIV